VTRSVLVFRLAAGRRDAFVEMFRRLEVLRRSSRQPGFLRAQLFVRADDTDEALVTADWESPEAYQGWLDNPVRAEIGEHLEPLLAAEPEPRVYELVEDVGPDREGA